MHWQAFSNYILVLERCEHQHAASTLYLRKPQRQLTEGESRRNSTSLELSSAKLQRISLLRVAVMQHRDRRLVVSILTHACHIGPGANVVLSELCQSVRMCCAVVVTTPRPRPIIRYHSKAQNTNFPNMQIFFGCRYWTQCSTDTVACWCLRGCRVCRPCIACRRSCTP